MLSYILAKFLNLYKDLYFSCVYKVGQRLFVCLFGIANFEIGCTGLPPLSLALQSLPSPTATSNLRRRSREKAQGTPTSFCAKLF